MQEAILAATGRYVRKLFAEVEVRVKALEARPLPEPGKSVTDEEVWPLVADLVDERIKALPAQSVDKDLEAEELGRFVEALVLRLDDPFTQ